MSIASRSSRLASRRFASSSRARTATLALAILSLLAPPVAAAPRSQAGRGQTAGVTFTDVTASAGIRFRHNSGAAGKKLLPETMGSGVAFFDADGDGWEDLFFVNSKNWPGNKGAPSYPALYRNNGNGTFSDITRASGLAVEIYGMGAAAADYDNDGDLDLYVTAVGPNKLFRNDKGKFVDVTAKAGVGDPSFSVSAAWFDYDRDGDLDLYVANYVVWTMETDLFCSLDGKTKSYCTPEAYKGQSPTLYRNRGNGTFEDVTKKAGLYDPTSKALGVALLDHNGDGWIDLAVANDTQPNRLYENRKNGTFEDIAVPAGIAFGETGVARAGMGIDAGDFDRSGRPGIVIGNFSNEMIALYRNEGNGLFTDDAPTNVVGKAGLLTLAFGCFFFDYDLDGLLDIFVTNGHVSDDINKAQPKITYAQPAHLFRNLGNRRFDDMSNRAGQAIAAAVVGRGAAYADYDRDGDLDIVVTANNGPARLLRNDGGNRANVLRVKVAGTTSNRSGIGARVDVSVSGRNQWALVKTGSSYASQSELTLTFGLGTATQVSAVQVTWPNGKVEKLGAVPANTFLVVQEGKGIVSRTPIDRSSTAAKVTRK